MRFPEAARTGGDLGGPGSFEFSFRDVSHPRYKATSHVVVIASNDAESGWDHLSARIVSPKEREPNWDEMCLLKLIFFGYDAVAMQLHPPEKDWVNNHKHVLHLWSPHAPNAIPLPPKEMV